MGSLHPRAGDGFVLINMFFAVRDVLGAIGSGTLLFAPAAAFTRPAPALDRVIYTHHRFRVVPLERPQSTTPLETTSRDHRCTRASATARASRIRERRGPIAAIHSGIEG
jgi:hypothetical protein